MFDPEDPDFIEAVTAYVTATGSTSTPAEISTALAAEISAQATRCRIPDEPPADLTEALCRRVAHNLAVRALPLGVQASITDVGALTTYVGGTDAEVRRLEAPWRKRVVG